MVQTTDFARLLSRFFGFYLVNQRGASPGTLATYRQSFSAFLGFLSVDKGRRILELTMKDFSYQNVTEFLDWVENNGGSGSTRNLRLAVLRSFASFVVHDMPDFMEECQKVLSIRYKKTQTGEMVYLKAEGMNVLLLQPDTRTQSGRRDYLMLSMFYSTGMRVSELIALTPSDISFSAPKTIRVLGKGNKVRLVPLVKYLEKPLRTYMEEHNLFSPEKRNSPMFRNHSGGTFSRQGVFLMVKKYAEKARKLMPDLIPQGIGCHTLRHSTAMGLVNSGVDLIYIRDLLGHSSVQTTEIYARSDTEAKRKAIESSAVALVPVEQPVWETDKSIMDWLKTMTTDNLM